MQSVASGFACTSAGRLARTSRRVLKAFHNFVSLSLLHDQACQVESARLRATCAAAIGDDGGAVRERSSAQTETKDLHEKSKVRNDLIEKGNRSIRDIIEGISQTESRSLKDSANVTEKSAGSGGDDAREA